MHREIAVIQQQAMRRRTGAMVARKKIDHSRSLEGPAQSKSEPKTVPPQSISCLFLSRSHLQVDSSSVDTHGQITGVPPSLCHNRATYSTQARHRQHLTAATMGSVVSTLANTVATASYYLLTPFWLKLWPPIQLLYLICKRTVLRANNLNLAPITLPTEDQVREGATPSSQRTFEGSGNNSSVRTMGMSGCPFARNTPKRAADASVGPDVAQVSEQLLARPGGVTKTKPLVNLLGGKCWPTCGCRRGLDMQSRHVLHPCVPNCPFPQVPGCNSWCMIGLKYRRTCQHHPSSSRCLREARCPCSPPQCPRTTPASTVSWPFAEPRLPEI